MRSHNYATVQALVAQAAKRDIDPTEAPLRLAREVLKTLVRKKARVSFLDSEGAGAPLGTAAWVFNPRLQLSFDGDEPQVPAARDCCRLPLCIPPGLELCIRRPTPAPRLPLVCDADVLGGDRRCGQLARRARLPHHAEHGPWPPPPLPACLLGRSRRPCDCSAVQLLCWVRLVSPPSCHPLAYSTRARRIQRLLMRASRSSSRRTPRGSRISSCRARRTRGAVAALRCTS